MKKAFFAVCITFAMMMSGPVLASPVPMVDVKVELQDRSVPSPMPRNFSDRIIKAYTKAINDEVERVGQLDILAVGPRATIVITEYYDPSDAMTKTRNASDRQMAFAGGGVNVNAPRFKETMKREYGNGRPETARVAGFIEYDGRRIPFEARALGQGPAHGLSADVARNAFRTLSAL